MKNMSLKKVVDYVTHTIRPYFSVVSTIFLTNLFTRQDAKGGFLITVRSFEVFIRLCIAKSRIILKGIINRMDALSAFRLYCEIIM